MCFSKQETLIPWKLSGTQLYCYSENVIINMNNFKKSILSFLREKEVSQLFRESLLIVFSILLAFVINEWRASQKLQTEKEKILASIKLELENNLKSLRQVRPYHKEVAQSLKELLTQEHVKDSLGDKSGIELFFQYAGQGFQEPRVQANAWQTAQLSGTLSQFDNETIYHLSVLYELQKEGVETGWKKTVESFYESESFEPSVNYAILQKFQLAMNSLHGMERYLIEKHEKTLKYLNEEKDL